VIALLVIWSLLAVHTLHHIAQDEDLHLDEWCKTAFSSVFYSTMYFMKTVVAGDSWGACAVPIVEREPWTLLIFGGSLLTVTFGATNLILAVIVEMSVQAREADSLAVIMQKRRENIDFANKLHSVLQKADADGSGTLTLDELVRGYEGDATLRQEFNKMDIDRTDLRNLYYLMGADEHVGLGYAELVSLLQKARLQDQRVYLMTMRLQIEHIAATLNGRHLNRSQESLPYNPMGLADTNSDVSDAASAHAEQQHVSRRGSVPSESAANGLETQPHRSNLEELHLLQQDRRAPSEVEGSSSGDALVSQGDALV